MRIGNIQITRLPKVKEIQRKLPLEWFYQFPDGTNIYTYRDSDLPQISGRYYDQVKQELQFLAEYGLDKATVEKYDEALNKLVSDGLNLKRPQGEVLADIKRVIDEKKNLFKFNRDLHRNMWLNLYCFFFVLEGEDELHFSEAENKRKIDLLNSLPEREQDFFFDWLQRKLEYYSDGLKSDIANYMMSQAAHATKIKGGDLGDYLSTLIKMTASTSSAADGQG